MCVMSLSDDENKPIWSVWAVGVLSHDDDDEKNKPVWPTWAPGVFSDDDDNENKPV